MLARAAGAHSLSHVPHVKLRSGVWIQTQFRRSSSKPAVSLPVYFQSLLGTHSTSPPIIFHLFSKPLCPLCVPPLLAAQHRGFKEKKKTLASKVTKKWHLLLELRRQWRHLSASHLSQCSKTWQVQTILVFTWLFATLKGRSGVQKTKISSTESKGGGCGRRNHSWCGSCSQSHAINDTRSSCSSVGDGFSWHEDIGSSTPWPDLQPKLYFCSLQTAGSIPEIQYLRDF